MSKTEKRKSKFLGRILLIIAMFALIYFLVPGVLGDKKISPEQKSSLMQQYVADNELSYEKFMPDKWFAACHIYGAKKKGGELLVYAHVTDLEFVVLNGKAYDVSGSSAPCVMHTRVDGDKLKLVSTEYPEDGEYYLESIRKMFPLRYYLKYAVRESITPIDLGEELRDKVRREWDVEVSDNLLFIDDESNTYEIIKTYDDMDENGEYSFETETIEEGVLE